MHFSFIYNSSIIINRQACIGKFIKTIRQTAFSLTYILAIVYAHTASSRTYVRSIIFKLLKRSNKNSKIKAINCGGENHFKIGTITKKKHSKGNCQLF